MQSQGPNYLAGSTKPLPGSENVLALELRELGELRGIGELFHVHKTQDSETATRTQQLFHFWVETL